MLLLFLKDTVKPRGLSSNLKLDKSAPMQPNPIPSNNKTADSVQRGDSGDHDDRGDSGDHDDRGDSGDHDSVAFNKTDNEDLGFTHYSTHDENQDDGEVKGQEKSLVQDNPRKRKRNGLNAKYNEIIIAIEMQKTKFLEEAIKNRQPENEYLLFFSQPFAPHQQPTSQYKITFQNPHPTSC
jgi:hypothetical protein